ncbi:MAG: MBOAT family protein [Ruminococcaceae bacterium]|nr:MBOAT family protein [Oscillospiraceae bacterium]
MVFSSLLFLFRYLPVVLILYFILPKRFRNLLLFVVSLIFYAWGEPVYVTIMIFSTVVDYTHGLLVEKFMAQGRTRAAKTVVASSMIINLSLLGFFKYTDFFLTNINAIFGTDIKLLGIALPIGISFYTFQTMSYTVDVYRGDAKAQHNIIDFGAYVALFPQLIAGPIVQYKTIADQLNNRRENIDDFASGVSRFMTGVGKKVLLANNAGVIWDAVSGGDLTTLPALTAWIGILAYSFQIYFDFSGYSDMAIGLGRMLGFHFLENFNYPYLSRSITEFWRRWHISLGSWFRDYVYIPLGGNRHGFAKQIRNICVVWLLTGLWHGASWNFVLWGVYFGILLIIEKLFLLKILEKLPRAISHIYTLFLVIISWAIFAIEDMGRLGQFIGALFGAGGSLLDEKSLYLLANNAILFIILTIAATPAPRRLAGRLMEKLGDKPAAAILQNVVFVGIFIISVAYLVDATYNPFLYFRF